MSSSHVSTLKLKSSRKKPPELLPTFSDDLNNLKTEQIVASVLEACSLEGQILAIRAVSQKNFSYGICFKI